MKRLFTKISITVLVLGIVTGTQITNDAEAANKGCNIPCIGFKY